MLGHAFAAMIESLRALVGQVIDAAEKVGAGASDLAEATGHISATSGSIAQAIDAVARGTQQQTEVVG